MIDLRAVRASLMSGNRVVAGASDDKHRVTSMCMEIAGFDHDDCPGDWCRCECHRTKAAS